MKPNYKVQNISIQYNPQKDSNLYRIVYDGDGQPGWVTLEINMSELYSSYQTGNELLVGKVSALSYDLADGVRAYLAKSGGLDYGMGWNNGGITGTAIDFNYSDKYNKISYVPPAHKGHVHINVDTNLDHKYYEKVKEYLKVEFPSMPTKQDQWFGSNAYNGPDAAIDYLPGASERVKHPILDDLMDTCQNYAEARVHRLIIHLNDHHKWTREAIADWLETLDIDLRFRTEDDRLRELRAKKIEEYQKAIASLKESANRFAKQMAEANEKISEFTAKMSQLQEENNEQD